MRIVREKARRTQRSITCKNLNWHKAETLARSGGQSLSSVIDTLLDKINEQEENSERIKKSSSSLRTE
jgi:macrodomain Ter protein organizer (MatP/YcbG family)